MKKKQAIELLELYWQYLSNDRELYLVCQSADGSTTYNSCMTFDREINALLQDKSKGYIGLGEQERLEKLDKMDTATLCWVTGKIKELNIEMKTTEMIDVKGSLINPLHPHTVLPSLSCLLTHPDLGFKYKFKEGESRDGTPPTCIEAIFRHVPQPAVAAGYDEMGLFRSDSRGATDPCARKPIRSEGRGSLLAGEQQTPVHGSPSSRKC